MQVFSQFDIQSSCTFGRGTIPLGGGVRGCKYLPSCGSQDRKCIPALLGVYHHQINLWMFLLIFIYVCRPFGYELSRRFGLAYRTYFAWLVRKVDGFL